MSADPAEYHAILTLQRAAPDGIEIANYSGTVIFKPGTPRAQAYAFLLNDSRASAGWGEHDGYVMYFSLEPNTL